MDDGPAKAGAAETAPGRGGRSAPGDGPAAGSRPAPGGALDGTGWILARYRDGVTLVEVPAGIHADAWFADGRVAGSAGCNSFTAAYAAVPTAEGGAAGGVASGDGAWVGRAPSADGTGVPARAPLRIGPCATTMMACPPPQADVERGFLAALAAADAYVADGDRLALVDASGATVAELVAVPVDAYAGAWEVTGVNNGRQAVASLVSGSAITLDLEPGGRVTGNATCNRYVGAYAVDGEAISFDPLATTRMACPTDALAEQERAYLAALAAAAAWSVSGGRLELRDASGALQVVCRRA
jgi:heat shock protein HslJ